MAEPTEDTPTPDAAPAAPGAGTAGQDEPPAAVETPDGVEHVGVLPASAAVVPGPRADRAARIEARRAERTGWYRSRSGTVMHADGPDQKRAYEDRGWTEISEQEAKDIVATGAQLVVDPRDGKGTFDADAVQAAVRDEAGPDPKRSAAAKKAAETRKRNEKAAQADADGITADAD